MRVEGSCRCGWRMEVLLLSLAGAALGFQDRSAGLAISLSEAPSNFCGLRGKGTPSGCSWRGLTMFVLISPSGIPFSSCNLTPNPLYSGIAGRVAARYACMPPRSAKSVPHLTNLDSIDMRGCRPSSSEDPHTFRPATREPESAPPNNATDDRLPKTQRQSPPDRPSLSATAPPRPKPTRPSNSLSRPPPPGV